MKALLVRVGIDNEYGRWNAPADPATGEYVYVPIPEGLGVEFHPGHDRPYTLTLPALERFGAQRRLNLLTDLRMPTDLPRHMMHLDPDFENLTYGDRGHRRGAEMRTMQSGDVIVFYSGLRSIRPVKDRLIYALIGLYTVDEVLDAVQVEQHRRDENAHTRKVTLAETDIVVRAKRGESGRFSRFIDIGEYRERAYRVRQDVLDAWGGLSVKNGYIHRSGVPPRFLDPAQFMEWFARQDVALVTSNW